MGIWSSGLCGNTPLAIVGGLLLLLRYDLLNDMLSFRFYTRLVCEHSSRVALTIVLMIVVLRLGEQPVPEARPQSPDQHASRQQCS
jgi:hypothetical protein